MAIDPEEIMLALGKLESNIDSGRVQREDLSKSIDQARQSLHAARNDIQTVLAQNAVNLRQMLELERRVVIVESGTQRFNAIDADLKYLAKTLDILVTRYEFRPVQLIAFGLAGSLLLTVLGAVARVVLRI